MLKIQFFVKQHFLPPSKVIEIHTFWLKNHAGETYTLGWRPLNTLQPFTGMYRDLTGIRVDRDGFITVIDSIPAMTVVAELQLTGIICNTNRKFNILCCPQVNPCGNYRINQCLLPKQGWSCGFTSQITCM